MAIFHLRMQVIRRSEGRSAVAAASYRSGEDLYDEKYGKQHRGFRKERYLIESEILAPENAPDWVYNRERLWNEVEKAEDKSTRRATAQLAREFDVALPREMSYESQRELLLDFVQKEFVDRGMIADVCIHRNDSENPHAHVMLTMREITPEGFANKNREWNGDFVTYKEAEKVGKGWRNNVNVENLLEWRGKWAEYANRYLEREGIEARIDHRSLKEQGLADRVPTVHEGPSVREMEERGIQTDRGDLNRAAKEHNAIVVELEAYRQEKAVRQEIEPQKADFGRLEAESKLVAARQENNTSQERGEARMSAIEKRPDMAFQFYSEQKERLDKEYGLYKRRESLVNQRENLMEALENDRSLKRGEKAEIREKIVDLETKIAKIPEPSEFRMSMLRDEYRQVETKLKEIMEIARDRVASRTTDQPQKIDPVKERAAALPDNEKQENIKKQRIVLFNERSKAEGEFNLLNDQQQRREGRVRSIDDQLSELQPKNLWQRMTNSNKELIQKLQYERVALEQEIRDRTPELEAAKNKFDKVHQEYQELNAAYRSGSQMEHQEKIRHRQATRDTQEYER